MSNQEPKPEQKPEDKPEDNLSVLTGTKDTKGKSTNPLWWIPTANFSSGLPYVIVNSTSRLVFKTMGVSNAAITFWTGLLLTPWTLKPFWGPLVDRYGTKRDWIVGTQLILALTLLLSAFALLLPTNPLGEFLGFLNTATGLGSLPAFFGVAIFLLFIMAIASATYDIACDGYYMIALREKQMSFFVGIRSSFYRVAMILGGGIIPVIAGYIQIATGPPPLLINVSVDTPAIATAVDIDPDAVVEPPEIPLDEPVAGAPAVSLDDLVFMPPPETDRIAVLTTSDNVSAAPGETIVFHIRLAESPAPGQEIVAITTQRRGNTWIRLDLDSERITFTDANWDQPREIRIALDQRLRGDEQALYQITAGNVPFSWALVFGLSGAFFLLLGAYHYVILPRPFEDEVNRGVEKPSIFKPITMLGLAVGGFFGILWINDAIFSFVLLDTLRSAVDFSERSANIQRAFGIFFNTIKYVIFAIFILIIFRIPSIRKVINDTFFGMSKASGIDFADVYTNFFTKSFIGISIAFILLFRLGESQIVALGPLFLIESRDNGGLGLSVIEVGLIYQVVGVACLTIGGIIGGFLISWLGLRKAIWPLVAAMHLPNALYVYLAYFQPESIFVIASFIAVEQLGYGIGFASFMMYLIMVAQGPFKTSHYAICTGFMSLGMQIPMMLSGAVQEAFGYVTTFVLACILVLPGTLLIPFLPLDGLDKDKKR